MQVVESIKKAREKDVSDDLILQEIRKQNPEKNPFFEKAIERGATPTKILDEIIKQNTLQESVQKPAFDTTATTSTAPPSDANVVVEKPVPLFDNKKSENETTNKTLLTKEAQEEEEDMRKRFLKRIEAKERGEVTDEGQFFAPSAMEAGAQNSGQEMTGDISSPKARSPKLLIIIGVGVLLFIGFAFLIFSLF